MSEAINKDLAQHHGLTRGVYTFPRTPGSGGEQRRPVEEDLLEGVHGSGSLATLEH